MSTYERLCEAQYLMEPDDELEFYEQDPFDDSAYDAMNEDNWT